MTFQRKVLAFLAEGLGDERKVWAFQRRFVQLNHPPPGKRR